MANEKPQTGKETRVLPLVDQPYYLAKRLEYGPMISHETWESALNALFQYDFDPAAYVERHIPTHAKFPGYEGAALLKALTTGASLAYLEPDRFKEGSSTQTNAAQALSRAVLWEYHSYPTRPYINKEFRDSELTSYFYFPATVKSIVEQGGLGRWGKQEDLISDIQKNISIALKTGQLDRFEHDLIQTQLLTEVLVYTLYTSFKPENPFEHWLNALKNQKYLFKGNEQHQAVHAAAEIIRSNPADFPDPHPALSKIVEYYVAQMREDTVATEKLLILLDQADPQTQAEIYSYLSDYIDLYPSAMSNFAHAYVDSPNQERQHAVAVAMRFTSSTFHKDTLQHMYYQLLSYEMPVRKTALVSAAIAVQDPSLSAESKAHLEYNIVDSLTWASSLIDDIYPALYAVADPTLALKIFNKMAVERVMINGREQDRALESLLSALDKWITHSSGIDIRKWTSEAQIARIPYAYKAQIREKLKLASSAKRAPPHVTP